MEQLKNADGVTEDGSQRTFISAIKKTKVLSRESNSRKKTGNSQQYKRKSVA